MGRDHSLGVLQARRRSQSFSIGTHVSRISYLELRATVRFPGTPARAAGSGLPMSRRQTDVLIINKWLGCSGRRCKEHIRTSEIHSRNFYVFLTGEHPPAQK